MGFADKGKVEHVKGGFVYEAVAVLPSLQCNRKPNIRHIQKMKGEKTQVWTDHSVDNKFNKRKINDSLTLTNSDIYT